MAAMAIPTKITNVDSPGRYIVSADLRPLETKTRIRAQSWDPAIRYPLLVPSETGKELSTPSSKVYQNKRYKRKCKVKHLCKVGTRDIRGDPVMPLSTEASISNQNRSGAQPK